MRDISDMLGVGRPIDVTLLPRDHAGRPYSRLRATPAVKCQHFMDNGTAFRHTWREVAPRFCFTRSNMFSALKKKSSRKFHFVEDYERHVKTLMRNHPLDEAMSLAVGGSYNEIGEIAANLVVYGGARDGSAVLDFGCGSGRVAHKLAQKISVSSYLGIDVVQALLDYAKTKTPANYRFVCSQSLTIPSPDNSVDIAYAFSVFTHLLQSEIFIYMAEIHRTLKPGGRFVFSFLELAAPDQWFIFQDSVQTQRDQTSPHLNMFIERSQIEVMAGKCDLKLVEFLGDEGSSYAGPSLGQSVCILEKP